MGYLGLTPTTAQQNYLNIDDISGSFDGSTTSFALLTGGVAPTPFPVTNSCLISVGGVIQEPDDTGTSGFRISGSNIVFSSAPGTGEDFFGLILAGADYLNIGANFPVGTVGTPSITFDGDTNTGIYHPSADELSFVTGGSDRVRVDSNGRVGIGTSSPSAPLHVVTNTTNDYLKVAETNLTFSNSIACATDVLSGSLVFRTHDSLTGQNNTAASIRSYARGAWLFNSHPQDLRFFTTATSSTTPTERLRITESGNVGIGTTSPSKNVDITGTTSRITVDADNAYTLVNHVNSAGTAYAHSVQSAGTYRFQIGTTERARIDSDGRLLVGTSSSTAIGSGSAASVQVATNTSSIHQSWIDYSNSNNPSRIVLGKSISGTIGTAGAGIPSNYLLGEIRFAGSNSSVLSGIGAQIKAINDGSTWTTSSTPGALTFYTTASGGTTSAERMRIQGNGILVVGAVYTNTTASAANVFVDSNGKFFRSTSSIKYKTDVETLQDSYADAILNCRPVWYRSTTGNDNSEWGWWGFIAEEVAEIDPRLVHWKTTEITYDEKGSAVETPCDPEPEGVAYDRFVPHLLNLIKRQQQAIETLEAKVAALEAN